MAVLDAQQAQQVAKRVEDWKLKLIDLTRRNRAIYFQPTKISTIVLLNPEMENIFSRLVVRNRVCVIWQPPQSPLGEPLGKLKPQKSTDLVPGWSDPLQLERILRNLTRRSASEYTERGVRVLHITFGQLKWFEKDSKQEVLSPILLTPVELSRESAKGPYGIKVPPVEYAVIVNPALRLKLKNDFGVELPSFLEDEEQTPTGYLAAVEKMVEAYGWTVEPTVYLGLFSFSKLAIYQDLCDNLPQLVKHPVLRALSGVSVEDLVKSDLPKMEDLDSIVDPKETFQILDADSSQQLCIQYALRGQSFVMQGPPGTGKSQTIANIISEYIAVGKSVLFVSEKMAALEVVYNRLKDKNLDEYCLELHSYKANKREVINELSRVLTEHLRAGSSMSDEEVDRLRKRRDQLDTYVEALHKNRAPINQSVFQMLDMVAGLKSVPDVPSLYASFDTLDQKILFDFEEGIRRISNSWMVVEEGASFPWAGCLASSYSIDVRSEWMTLLRSIIESSNHLNQYANNYCEEFGLTTPESLNDFDVLQKLANIISSTPYPPEKWLEDTNLTDVRKEADGLKDEWGGYWTIRKELESRYDSRFRSLPKGVADKVENAWIKTSELLEPQEKGDGGLLKNLSLIQDYIKNTLLRIRVWEKLAEAISATLGVEFDSITIDTARRLIRISELCQVVNRPERRWLDESTLNDTRKIIETAQKEYSRRDELKKQLSEYRDEVINLDLESLIEYLEGPGASFFRFFRPSYYRVREDISKAVRSGKIPPMVLSDLKVALEFRELLKRIAVNQGELKSVLGSFHRLSDPDFEGASEALKVAEEIMKLTDSKRVSKALKDNLCVGTKPMEEVIKTSRELKESLSSWTVESRSLHGLLPKKLPGKPIRVTNAPLNELKEWLKELEERLSDLHEVSAKPLATAISVKPEDYIRLLSDMRKAERLQVFEESKAEKIHVYRETYGDLYQGITTDWDKVVEAIEWTKGLLKSLPAKSSPMIKRTVTDPVFELPILDVEADIRKIFVSVDEINSRFAKPVWSRSSSSLSVEEILVVAENFASRIGDLQVWVDFNESVSALSGKGLGGFVSRLIEKRCDREILVDVFTKSMYNGLLTRFLEEDAALRSFRGKSQDQVVEDFRSLDRALIEESAPKIIKLANINKPQGVFVEAPDSEISILLKEAAKKRRQMPLRHLFDRIPNLVRKLKPCFLMSPISVSQFLLPERLHFDLVIFDEASQIFTEDAIGSIYRGDCLIVAGDNKQLPPTPFFRYVADSDTEWDELTNDMDVYDSVLDECMGIGLLVKMLQWHYRSRHDSLIAFSNSQFYDDRLVLFPSAIHRGDGLGIEFIHVPDGVYDRGGARNNQREAEVVADIVFKHFKENPMKSLGVVTFSISQMNAVRDEVEARLVNNPEYEKYLIEDRLSGFFVKNLENVQGDERDVMVVSVGYGFDKNGVLTMNFGPLNKEGGERRLNVAITRARERVILVSSIKSGNIDLSSSNAVGVRCLRDYLIYAENETARLVEKDRIGVEELTNMEKEIAEEIRGLGYIAVPRVGEGSLKVDIGVKTVGDLDRFILGVILDGDYYRATVTARDRDRLRSQVLENMGWNIHRIWSPEWVQRRESEVERLRDALKRVEKGKSLSSVTSGSKKIVKKKLMEQSKVSEKKGNELPGVEPYRKAVLESRQSFEKFSPEKKDVFLKQYRLEVKHLLPKLVRIEGPIHIDSAFQQLNKALVLNHASVSFRRIYLELLKDLILKDRFQRRGEFLWPDGKRVVKVRAPGQGNEAIVRPLEHICSEEIEAMMLHILEHSMGLSQDSLIKETAATYLLRVTPKTENKLKTEVERMINENKVRRIEGDTLVLA